jgi:hypothetical protein
MPTAAPPRQKRSPTASSTSSSSPPPSSPHRSPRLIRLPSRSTPAPPLLDQMEELTIKDRRSQPPQGKVQSLQGDSQESRMAGLGHGHQRRPADLGRTGSNQPPSQPQRTGQTQYRNDVLAPGIPDKIGFRSPSSEPSFMEPIHARSGGDNGTESSSSSDRSTIKDGSVSSHSRETTDDGETIRRYQGGDDLSRTQTRRTSCAPLPSDLPSRAHSRQPDQLRDPYDFTKSYGDDLDDEDDHGYYDRQQTEEVATRAGTPLFSAGPEERYELLQKLGQGNFGTVWKA